MGLVTDKLVKIREKAIKVADAKRQLNATDYKIIKAYEYSLVGLEQPYDIHALHAERQALRDEINSLGGSV